MSELIPVLYVENDVADVFLMEQAWKKAGLPNALYVVRDGQEALDFLSGEGLFHRAVHPMPGLVLLDLKLPRVHGLQVLQWIREQPTTRALRVIILSSSNQERDTAKALGITDYWLKSAEPGVLFKMVASLKGLVAVVSGHTGVSTVTGPALD